MLVKRIDAYAQQFEANLQERSTLPSSFVWESVQHFQQHWDSDAPDLAATYDHCLQNSHTRRLWKGENYRPKEMMLRFFQMDTEFCRRMFKDLLDEGQDIENRVSRFKFGCEELLADYKAQHQSSIDNRHFHEDNRMISLYLFFHNPQEYALFDYPPFEKTLRLLGNTGIPTPFEIGRYFKLLRLLRKFLLRQERLGAIYLSKVPDMVHFQAPPLLMAHDFCQFCNVRF